MDHFKPAVYILASKYQGVLYTGVTSNLPQRIWQHKHKLVDGFSRQYNVERFVWYELHVEMYAAITREKQIKKWNRAWKIELIETDNPNWNDRFEEILG
jgi:putative endonuclease